MFLDLIIVCSRLLWKDRDKSRILVTIVVRMLRF
jgi:hypothetical protein